MQKVKVLEEDMYRDEFYKLNKEMWTSTEHFIRLAEFYIKLGMDEYAAELYLRLISTENSEIQKRYADLKEKQKKLYEDGDAKAGYRMGMIAYYEKDYEKAKKFLEEAYKKNVHLSSFGLGMLYFFGEAVEEDVEKAYRLACEAYKCRQDCYTADMLAGCIVYGEGVSKDYQLAVELFKQMAEYEFDGEKERIIGKLYFDEDYRDGNLPRNATLAEFYLKTAFEKGNKKAGAELSELYGEEVDDYVDRYGILSPEVKKLLDDYVYYTRTAYEAGEYDVGTAYATFYLDGMTDRIEKNVSKAWEILKEGIDNGNLVCKFGMLDYTLSGKLPVKTELAWIEQLINELEEDGADMSEYRRRFQRLYHKKNKKGCYITTAVCESEGKADDCYELQSFRRFRDEWLEKQPDGMELIQEYYATAPEIVEKINQQPDRKVIYENIKNTYLNPCLMHIEQGEFEKCKELYIEMMRSIGN